METKIKAYKIKEGRFKIELGKAYGGRLVLPMYINKPPTAKVQLTLIVQESDFDEDMKILVPVSIGDDLFDTCYELLRKLIKSHIMRFGRILPADLETYCTEYVLVISSIVEAGGKPLNPTAKKYVFKSILTKLSDELNLPIELRL
jgi:hypothetical protein